MTEEVSRGETTDWTATLGGMGRTQRCSGTKSMASEEDGARVDGMDACHVFCG
jgi:hypothetical protein